MSLIRTDTQSHVKLTKYIYAVSKLCLTGFCIYAREMERKYSPSDIQAKMGGWDGSRGG